MGKQSFQQRVRELKFGQWWLISAPAVAAFPAAWFERHEMEGLMPFCLIGGGLAISGLLLFLMLYGEDL